MKARQYTFYFVFALSIASSVVSRSGIVSSSQGSQQAERSKDAHLRRKGQSEKNVDDGVIVNKFCENIRRYGNKDMELPAEGLLFGRLLPSHQLFQPGNTACQMIQRLGVFDEDSEELCHSVIKTFFCYDPGCGLQFNSVMEYDLHYNSLHRYSCATCGRNFASPHLLDLHVEETHDSFFAVQAERKPMYRCFVESCLSLFTNSQERHSHCIESHSFPSNFRWTTSKSLKGKSKKNKPSKAIHQAMADEQEMEQDVNTNKSYNEFSKHKQGIVFGRGMKKSFVTNSHKKSDWHKKHLTGGVLSKKSVLETSNLSSDLMECLPPENSSQGTNIIATK